MARSNLIKIKVLLGLVLGICIALAGCNGTDFNDGRVRGVVEANPVRIDAEQVTLSYAQVDCGIKNDLWDPPGPASEGSRSTARLTAQGRALNFADDVSIGEPGYKQPYAQVRGNLPLAILDVVNTKDGREKFTKLAEVKVGVKIDHACFPTPLPIMGLRKGGFTPDANPVLSFRLDNGWQLENFVH
jgi:hypothetical protein